MYPMTSRRAFVTAAVRGVAFALVTALFTAVPLFHGFLWCVYIGFFLTMAFGVKLPEYPNYLCSLLVGYVWALAYVFGHQWLEAWFAMPSLLALSLSELVLTFLLIFVHLRFLSRTWLNKVPAVFAAVATVFAAGGIQHLPLCALSAVIGISMAVGTEVLIQRLVK